MSNKPTYVNIENDSSLVRDTHSMGVLNMNSHALAQAKRLHAQALEKLAEERQKEIELNTLRREVSDLKGAVTDLTSLTAKLLEKLDATTNSSVD